MWERTLDCSCPDGERTTVMRRSRERSIWYSASGLAPPQTSLSVSLECAQSLWSRGTAAGSRFNTSDLDQIMKWEQRFIPQSSTESPLTPDSIYWISIWSHTNQYFYKSCNTETHNRPQTRRTKTFVWENYIKILKKLDVNFHFYVKVSGRSETFLIQVCNIKTTAAKSVS